MSRWLALGAVLLVAGAVRARQLEQVGYTFDESFCVKMASFSVAEIWSRSGQDTHPPLYFLMLKAWAAVCGESPQALRALSVLFGLAAVAGVYALVCEAYGRLPARPPRGGASPQSPPPEPGATAAALLAAAFVALSPLQIFWSQQVRMYSAGTALVAWSSLLLLRALHRQPARGRDWAAYATAAILMIYTHHFALFTLAAQALYAAGWLVRRGDGTLLLRLFPLAVTLIAVWLAWQPWLLDFLDQRQRVTEFFWSKPIDWSLAGGQIYQIFAARHWPGGEGAAGLAIAQAAWVGLLLLVAGRRPADGFIALAAFLPIAAAALASSLGRNIFISRYLMFAHLFLMMAAATLIVRIPWRLLRWLVAAGALLGLSATAWLHVELRDKMALLPGLRAAVARFDALQRPGELLLVCNPMLYTSVWAWTRDRTACFAEGAHNGYPYFQGTAVMKEEEYLEADTLTASDRHWVWTLDADRWFGHPWTTLLPPQWKCIAETRYREHYADLVLRLYERPASANPAAREQ